MIYSMYTTKKGEPYKAGFVCNGCDKYSKAVAKTHKEVKWSMLPKSWGVRQEYVRTPTGKIKRQHGSPMWTVQHFCPACCKARRLNKKDMSIH
jgi:hypothetical protein